MMQNPEIKLDKLGSHYPKIFVSACVEKVWEEIRDRENKYYAQKFEISLSNLIATQLKLTSNHDLDQGILKNSMLSYLNSKCSMIF